MIVPRYFIITNCLFASNAPTSVALRHQAGTVGSDPRCQMIIADSSVVEQESQSVVGEVAESAGAPFGVFDQVEVPRTPV